MKKIDASWEQIGEKFVQTMDRNQLAQCMRCGFCLPACPTYRETGQEEASPRGRIALMKALSEGLITPDQRIIDQMELCLGCRACEPACPAGVPFGQLLEQARSIIAEPLPRSPMSRFLRRLFFHWLFPYPRRLRLIGSIIAFYQRSGMQQLFRHFGIPRLFPTPLEEMEKVLPQANPRGVRKYLGHTIPAQGKKRSRVGLFHGCIMDILFTKTNINTVQLLTKAGYEVVIPSGQTCCGALHAHAGEKKWAIHLAEKNIAAFQQAEVEWIVSNAGGCGAMLREYPHLLRHHGNLLADAHTFSHSIQDVSQLLLQAQGALPLHNLSAQLVTYQDSCHLRNGMGVVQEPRQLLRSTPGITLVEMKEADRCCGSAGIYNLTHPGLSLSLLDKKMEDLRATKVDTLVTTNPGCFLQMKMGVLRAGLTHRIRILHLVDLLAEAMEEVKDQ